RSSSGSRLVTYVPSPCRGSRTPISVSARTASRSELRDKPRRSASSRSFGSFEPGANSPSTISSLILRIASSVSAIGLVCQAVETAGGSAEDIVDRCGRDGLDGEARFGPDALVVAVQQRDRPVTPP